jgi:predicted Fe-Mo cluster-binding NifX family protein
MKIAVCAIGKTSTSAVAPFCGCDGEFVVYDSDKLKFSYSSGSAKANSYSHSGIPCGKVMADEGIEVLVVSEIAIHAARRLGRYGIRIYRCVSTTVWEAIQGLKLNLLQSVDIDSGKSGRWHITDD